MRTYSRKKVQYQVIEGVKELCRLCLEKCEEVVPIFTDNSDVCAPLPMRIMICVGLEMVREDSLPNIICQTCFKELERYYTFRKKCEVTYQKLKAHVMAVKEQEANKPSVEKMKLDADDSALVQEMEIQLQNGEVDAQLVLALNENEQLELVNVVSLNGVVQKLEDLPNDQELQQEMDKEDREKNEFQMQDVSTNQEASNESTTETDMSVLLSSILLRLGLVSRRGGALRLEPGARELRLEAAGGRTLALELVEEDDSETATSLPQIFHETKPPTPEVKVPLEMVKDHTPTETINEKTSKLRKKTAKTMKDDTGQQAGAGAGGAGAGCVCLVCGKALSSRGALARHARAHSAARPHECARCGRGFTQRAVLARHELVHAEKRPFACSMCDKSFTQRAALAAHARAHAPPHARALALHRCASCPKVFLYPSGLSRHMAVHEGRVFACDRCGRAFRDKSALARHLAHAHAR